MTKGAVRVIISVFVFGLTSLVAQAETPNRCARYGADYAPVAGSNGCVRLGGHIRVDQARMEPAAKIPPMSYTGADGVQSASAHMTQQPVGPFELFRR